MEINWGKKHRDKTHFLLGRDGDHTMVCFECDTCIFRKLKGRDPIKENNEDILLEECIRRINLDSFWSSEPNSIKANISKLRVGERMSKLVGLHGPAIHIGPLPSHDHCGYEVAIQMILHSRLPGRNSKEYTQYETIRKTRTAHSNQVRASPQYNSVQFSMMDEKGGNRRASNDVCASWWFRKFSEGLCKRMGYISNKDRGMSLSLMVNVLKTIEEKILDSPQKSNAKHKWIVFSAYCTVSYVLSLRGCEGLLLDLEGLRKFWDPNRNYIVIALLGRIKGETGDRSHLIPCVNVTGSGIEVFKVVERLIMEKDKWGQVHGPGISNGRGTISSPWSLNELLHEVLLNIFNKSSHLFPPTILSEQDVRRSYSVSRTLRITSETQALNKNIMISTINLVNKWKMKERNNGVQTKSEMYVHYSEIEHLLGPFMSYTGAM